MQRGELSIGRAYSGSTPLGAIGALLVLALIALLVIQLIGQDGRGEPFGSASSSVAPEISSGSHHLGE